MPRDSKASSASRLIHGAAWLFLLSAACCLPLGMLGGCRARPRGSEQRPTEFYLSHDSVEDAKASFQQGDRRIYWATGIGRYFPGLSNETGADLEEHFRSRHLAGTTDVISGGAEMRYIEAATDYARAYNRQMARLLGVAESRL